MATVLGERQREVLAIFAEDSERWLDAGDIAKLSSFSWQQAQRTLDSLFSKGYLGWEWDDEGQSLTYRLKK